MQLIERAKTMTSKQIKWAAKHDWFISSDEKSVACRDYWTEWGVTYDLTVRFEDFQALLEWAGY